MTTNQMPEYLPPPYDPTIQTKPRWRYSLDYWIDIVKVVLFFVVLAIILYLACSFLGWIMESWYCGKSYQDPCQTFFESIQSQWEFVKGLRLW